jgi:hypothetical protein
MIDRILSLVSGFGIPLLDGQLHLRWLTSSSTAF